MPHETATIVNFMNSRTVNTISSSRDVYSTELMKLTFAVLCMLTTMDHTYCYKKKFFKFLYFHFPTSTAIYRFYYLRNLGCKHND